MGTRADFWIRKGSEQEWVGSIAWDGYHEGIPSSVKNAKTEEQYRLALKAMADDRDDFTHPSEGWPWPWDTGEITDCTYFFEGKKVYSAKGWIEYKDGTVEEGIVDANHKRIYKRVKSWIWPVMKTENSAAPGSKKSGVFLFRM